MQWTIQPTARLTVKESGTSNTFGFEGVNASNEAGTPEQFLAAANRLLGISEKTAVIDGIIRTIKQEATDNG